LEGAQGLTHHVDPHDKEPFTYTVLDGGFRLESRLIADGTPISLSILPNSEKETTIPK
jgi:hypothetical protein